MRWLGGSVSSCPASGWSVHRTATSGGPGSALVCAPKVRSRPPPSNSAPDPPFHIRADPLPMALARRYDDFFASHGSCGRRQRRRRAQRCGGRAVSAHGAARGLRGGRMGVARSRLHPRMARCTLEASVCLGPCVCRMPTLRLSVPPARAGSVMGWSPAVAELTGALGTRVAVARSRPLVRLWRRF